MTEARPAPAGHGEPHGGGMATRLNWLRAAVLGANDGIVSTAGLVVGVAGASSSRTAIFTAGLAGLFAGALAMASGEYVSVSSQRDSERAMLALERRELAEAPQAEVAELARLYEAKGLAPALAREVAERLTEHDAFAAHADAELGIDPGQLARPGTPPSRASCRSSPARYSRCWRSRSSPRRRVSPSRSSRCSPRSWGPGRRARRSAGHRDARRSCATCSAARSPWA